VGEIRDRETAEIAIQSSLTGHLVFSTLHTNDAASAVTRLIDMGIEPFLVTSSVIAIMAQRLVRVLCPKCKEEYTPDEESLANLGVDKARLEKHPVYRRMGCASCMNTGYRGRTAIFEILVLDDPIKRLILKTSDANQINDEAMKRGMTNSSRTAPRRSWTGSRRSKRSSASPESSSGKRTWKPEPRGARRFPGKRGRPVRGRFSPLLSFRA